MDEIKKYYASKRINNSLLNLVPNPYAAYKVMMEEDEDAEKKHFRVGGALDCLLTDGNNFSKYYRIIKVDRPGGLMEEFIRGLPRGLTEDSPASNYYTAHKRAGYKLKVENVIKKLWSIKKNKSFYEFLNPVDDRVVITKDEWASIQRMKDTLMTSKYYKYFMNVQSDIELIHQHAIYFEWMEEECKALLDITRVNHQTKTIEPIDLKTTGKPLEDFPLYYKQYGYYRQAAFYTEAIKWWIKNERPELQDYKILPFKFIVVESAKGPLCRTLMYICTENDITVGLTGGDDDRGRDWPGLKSLMDDLKWHKANNLWLFKREVYENDGQIMLNAFKTK